MMLIKAADFCSYFYLCFALETQRKVNINQRTERKQRLTTQLPSRTCTWNIGWAEYGCGPPKPPMQCIVFSYVFSFASKYKFRRNTLASWWKVEEDKSLLELYQKMKSKQKLSTWTLKIPQTSLRIQSLNLNTFSRSMDDEKRFIN